MILLPPHLFANYHAYCQRGGVSDADRADYLKWLRFFLDFCEKYQVADDNNLRISRFMDKLQEKGQNESKRRRASHAVSLYFRMLQESRDARQPMAPVVLPTKPQIHESISVPVGQQSVSIARKSYYSEAGYREKSASPEWDEVIAKMAAEIKVRHYSRKTLQTYAL